MRRKRALDARAALFGNRAPDRHFVATLLANRTVCAQISPK
jgi:hypothetical protein